MTMARGQAQGSGAGSGLTAQGADERPESCRELKVLRPERLALDFTQESETAREVDEIMRFGCRAGGNVQKMEILAPRAARRSFNDIH